VIKDLIPGKKSDPGRTGRDNRLFINAVLFVLKTGIPWDDLPGRFGKLNSVWKWYDRWCARGVWERLIQAMGEPELADEQEEVQIDSTSIKAHPVASTGPACPAHSSSASLNPSSERKYCSHTLYPDK